MNLKKAIRTVVLVLLALLLLSLLSTLFRDNSFRIINTDPNLSAFPTSSRNITIQFSEEIDPAIENNQISFMPSLAFDYTAEADKLFIRFLSTPNIDINYKLNLKDLKSTTGETKTFTETISFKYIPFNQLSEQERTIQQQESDSFEGDDELQNNLPIVTDEFNVFTRYPDGDFIKIPVLLTFNFTRDQFDDYENYKNKAKEVTQTVIDLINANGFNSDQHVLYLPEDFLLETFDGSSAGQYSEGE